MDTLSATPDQSLLCSVFFVGLWRNKNVLPRHFYLQQDVTRSCKSGDCILTNDQGCLSIRSDLVLNKLFTGGGVDILVIGFPAAERRPEAIFIRIEEHLL